VVAGRERTQPAREGLLTDWSNADTQPIPVGKPVRVPPAPAPAPPPRKRRTGWLIGVPAVALAAIVALLVVEWHPLYTYLRHGRLTVAAPPAPSAPRLRLTAAPDNGSAPEPSPGAIAGVLTPLAANPALGQFAGVVSDAATGSTLWSAAGDRPMVPASATKLLTAAAALLTLPLDHRLTTSVVRGAAPNQLVLVGGGDVTLTAQPVGAPSIYQGSPHLDDLAAQIQHAGITGVTSILVDTSAWSGPAVAPGWSTADIAGGDFSPMEPVMIDGGRLAPLNDDSPRTPTAALDAGRALATKLGVDPAQVSLGAAPPGGTPVASVQSATLQTRLREALLNSDNVLAESIAREAAQYTNAPASFDGAVRSDENILRQNGIDLTGVTLDDGNGLSVNDRIPPRVLDSILTAAAGPSLPKLRPLLDSLPVAGATGTLSDRYQNVNRAGAGWVRAKTGTLSIANALAGYVVDGSGRVLTFALMSNGETSSDSARPALDALASALRSCGCQ
jgi:D-alanyl-D-alanine carboxypeptidase/D-alanyl-D-alanine-endopeptidase (penicillin-binding protein 4)